MGTSTSRKRDTRSVEHWKHLPSVQSILKFSLAKTLEQMDKFSVPAAFAMIRQYNRNKQRDDDSYRYGSAGNYRRGKANSFGSGCNLCLLSIQNREVL